MDTGHIHDKTKHLLFSPVGTHWVWEMTSMVMKGKAEHEVLPKESSMLEFQTPARLAELPSPRILNGHQMPSFLPEQMFTKKIKIIHVYRNPKDVAVSLFHFSKKMPMFLPSMENKPYDSFSEFLPYFTGEYGVFFVNSIFEYYKEMEKFLGSRRDHTLNLCYEEMKRDPVAAVEQIAKFLDKDLSNDVIKDIAKKCSFKNLAAADDNLKQAATLPVLDNPGKFGTAEMYRKGEVGDWQNYFTNGENKDFDKVVNEHFKDSEWKFIYTL